MNKSRAPLVWGLLLVVGGALLLAQNLGVFGALTAPIWAIVFVGGCIAFFAAYFTQRGAWWYLFPAFALAGLAGAALIGQSGTNGELAGSVFLWSIALAFWGVFLTDRNHWWAVIPAGVLTTIGLIPLIANRVSGEATGAILFLGIALTFGLLYLMRGRYGSGTSWAIFPALGCLGMAVLLGVLGPLGRFWPVLFLILPGLYLLYNAFRPRANRGSTSGGGTAA